MKINKQIKKEASKSNLKIKLRLSMKLKQDFDLGREYLQFQSEVYIYIC